MPGQEDVEQFLWDLERELKHIGGEERRELVKEAEDLLHDVATQFAEAEDADRVRWFHYVQATAEVGPPERLAARLTGEEQPGDEDKNRWLWIGAGVLAVTLVAMVSYAWLTTGDLDPVGSWSGEERGLSDRRTLAFNTSEEADSVFLTMAFTPSTNGTAKITVLDGDTNLVYQEEATVSDHLETSEFVDGASGQWRVIVDFQDYTGGWSVEAKQELD